MNPTRGPGCGRCSRCRAIDDREHREPAAPAASKLATADAAVADQLRALATGKYDQLLGGKKDSGVVDAFYSGRDYAPVWITDGAANAHAKAAIAYLGHVDADGLDPADYPVPNFSGITDPAQLAAAELKLSASILTYARHASVGRIHWSRVSPDILFTSTAPEAADVLAKMVEAKDTAAALASYEPQTRGYVALKAKLAEIRAGTPAVDAASTHRTERPTDIILANMERWRWFPHDLGNN